MLLSSIIRKGMRNGDFRKVDIKSTTLAVYQLLNISLWHRADGSRRATAFALESYNLLFRGLQERQAQDD